MEMVLAKKQNDAKSGPEGPLGNGRGVVPTTFTPRVWGSRGLCHGLRQPLVVLEVLWSCSGCCAGLLPQTGLQVLPRLCCAGPSPHSGLLFL